MGITLPKMKHFRLNDQTIQTIYPVSKKLSKIQQIVKNATDNQQMWQIVFEMEFLLYIDKTNN